MTDEIRLSWSRDDEGVITIYATDPNTGRVAEVADFWTRPLREWLGLKEPHAKALQQAIAESLVWNWNGPPGREPEDIGLTDEITGIVHVAPGHGRRYRIGQDCGEIFEEGVDFDGVALTVECFNAEDGARMVDALQSFGRGDYHEGIAEGWKAGAEQERRIWTMAIETYFDGTAVMDCEKYVEEIRKGVEGE